jgi:hypothetical protein
MLAKAWAAVASFKALRNWARTVATFSGDARFEVTEEL